MALTPQTEAPKSSIGGNIKAGIFALGLALPASQAFADTNNAALDALAGRFGEKGAVVDASRSARGEILYADSGEIKTDAEVAVFTQDTFSFYTGEQLTYDEIQTRFTDAINALPQGGNTEIIEGGITIKEALEYIKTDENIALAIRYFAHSLPVDSAILKVYMDVRFKDMEQSSIDPELNGAYFRKIHAEAIQMGADEYVMNALALHPRYTTGRLSKLSIEEKKAKAQESYNFFIENFVNGVPTNIESYEEFATYNPGLAEYLVVVGDELNPEVVGNLQSTIALIGTQSEGEKLDAEGEKLDAEGEKLDAEGEKLDAEREKLDAELIRSQAELKAAFGKLAEAMKKKGIGA